MPCVPKSSRDCPPYTPCAVSTVGVALAPSRRTSLSIRELTTSTAHTEFGVMGDTASEMRCTVVPVAYTCNQVAPRSVLRYTPFAVVPAPARAAHTMLSLAGSNSTSLTKPVSTVVQAEPLLVLRCSPLLAAYSTTLVFCVPARLGATRIR